MKIMNIPLMATLLVVMASLATLWGIRLTINFAKDIARVYLGFSQEKSICLNLNNDSP